MASDLIRHFARRLPVAKFSAASRPASIKRSTVFTLTCRDSANCSGVNSDDMDFQPHLLSILDHVLCAA